MTISSLKWRGIIVVLALLGIVSIGLAQDSASSTMDDRPVAGLQAPPNVKTAAYPHLSSRLIRLYEVRQSTAEVRSLAASLALPMASEEIVYTSITATSEAEVSRIQAELSALGAVDFLSIGRWLDAAIPVDALEAAANIDGIALVDAQTHIYGLDNMSNTSMRAAAQNVNTDAIQSTLGQFTTLAGLNAASRSNDDLSSGQIGSFQTAGVQASGANQWTSAGYVGSGITVGVLGSFKLLGGAQSTGNLPGNSRIQTLGTLDTNAVLGTATAEVIYDMAPGVNFILSSPFSAVQMGDQIQQMADNGADIIVSTIGFFNAAPGDGTGPVSNVVTSITNTQNVLYVQAAGNQAQYNYNRAYLDTDIDGFHEFNDTLEVNRMSAQEGELIQIFLRWDDWGGADGQSSDEDFDLYLLYENTFGDLDFVEFSTTIQDGTQPPTESVTYVAETTGTFAWAVDFPQQRTDDIAGSAILDVQSFQSPPYTFNDVQRSLVDPATSSQALAVSALDVNSPYPREQYSSVGPTLGVGGTLDLATANNQPRVSGFANVNTYAYQTEFGSLFSGTSSATSHVGGAAALVRQAFPSLSAIQTRSFLQDRAIDQNSGAAPGYDYFQGYGRLNLGTPPAAELITNGSFSNGRTGWNVFGDVQSVVFQQALYFYRENPGWGGATVFQDTGTPLGNNTPIEARMKLGNSSGVPKAVEVVVRSQNFAQTISCSLTIPPNTQKTDFVMRGVSNTSWNSVFFAVRALDQDGIGNIILDDVSVREAGISVSSLECDGFETPANTTLMNNGNFNSGLRYWILFGDYQFNINSGIMTLYRATDVGDQQAAVLFQPVPRHIESGSPLRMFVRLGNSSNVARDVEVYVRDVNWRQFFRCTYTIPANTNLTYVRVQGQTNTEWGSPWVLIRDTNTLDRPNLLIDDASLTYLPGADVSNTCGNPSFGSGLGDAPREILEGEKAPAEILPDAGTLPDTDSNGASPLPNEAPNPGGMLEIPGF